PNPILQCRPRSTRNSERSRVRSKRSSFGRYSGGRTISAMRSWRSAPGQAERRGYGVEVLDVSEGEEAGIKGAVLEIRGQYAYGFLRPETGVHRLVRISPFDSNARRHTSFAQVFVYPVVDTEINIEIRDEDIRMDVFRA